MKVFWFSVISLVIIVGVLWFTKANHNSDEGQASNDNGNINEEIAKALSQEEAVSLLSNTIETLSEKMAYLGNDEGWFHDLNFSIEEEETQLALKETLSDVATEEFVENNKDLFGNFFRYSTYNYDIIPDRALPEVRATVNQNNNLLQIETFAPVQKSYHDEEYSGYNYTFNFEYIDSSWRLSDWEREETTNLNLFLDENETKRLVELIYEEANDIEYLGVDEEHSEIYKFKTEYYRAMISVNAETGEVSEEWLIQ